MRYLTVLFLLLLFVLPAAAQDKTIASVTGKAYRDLLEILDDRHGQGATLYGAETHPLR